MIPLGICTCSVVIGQAGQESEPNVLLREQGCQPESFPSTLRVLNKFKAKDLDWS